MLSFYVIFSFKMSPYFFFIKWFKEKYVQYVQWLLDPYKVGVEDILALTSILKPHEGFGKHFIKAFKQCFG